MLTNPAWSVDPDARIFGTDDRAIGNGLNNSGDTVAILDGSMGIVDTITYDDTDFSGCGNEADGDGYSLERVDPNEPSDCSNFRSMELASGGFPIGGTPGSENFLWAGSTCDCIPDGACAPGVNPHGKNVPPAGEKSPGRTEGGFYELLGFDPLDPNVYLFVTDASDGVTFGPFASGDVVKITEAQGAATSKAMGSGNGQADAVAAHIKLPSDAFVFAVDSMGTVGAVVACEVPPPPK